MKQLFMVAFLLLCCMVRAEELPDNFFRHYPTLVVALEDVWPDITQPAVIAGLVEQETCPSLKSKKCWNERAELKTKQEHGIGLGQHTITSKFNAFEETSHLHEKLKGWKVEDYWNAEMQLYGIAAKLKQNYSVFGNTIEEDRFAFSLAAYNGGVGGILKDQRLCKNTKGCDPAKWWDNVENTSLKTKLPFNGFKKSAFQINREYPYNILKIRMQKYEPYLNPFFMGVKYDWND